MLITALRTHIRFATVLVATISLAALVACGGGDTEEVAVTDVDWGYTVPVRLRTGQTSRQTTQTAPTG